MDLTGNNRRAVAAELAGDNKTPEWLQKAANMPYNALAMFLLNPVADAIGIGRDIAANAGAPVTPTGQGLTPQRAAQMAVDTGVLSAVAAKAPAGALRTFGGINARNADLNAYGKAKLMDMDGVPREQIWKETGWFKAPDGNWKFEIDDSAAAVRSNLARGEQDSGALSDVWKHSALYEAYPQLGDIDSVLNKTAWHQRGINGGYFMPPTKLDPAEIMVNQPSNAKARGSFLHEGQHGVQDIEGFATGTNPMQSGADGYKRSAGEAEARLVERRKDYTPQFRQKRPPWADYDVPESQQIVTTDPSAVAAKVDPSQVNKFLAALKGADPAKVEIPFRFSEDHLGNLKLNVGTRDGDILTTGGMKGFDASVTRYVDESHLPPHLRGTGTGDAMYETWVNDAFDKGLHVASDSRLSAGSRQKYERLKERGYDVRQNPNVREVAGRGGKLGLDATDGQHVFRVAKPGTPGTKFFTKTDPTTATVLELIKQYQAADEDSDLVTF